MITGEQIAKCLWKLICEKVNSGYGEIIKDTVHAHLF